jgi:predicted dehydrogenase
MAAPAGLRHHARYEALLDDPEVDAVYIPLPNSLHREWTIRAAEKGKHVLCEKPLGLTAAECREMGAAAEANGVKLMEAFMYRFHPRTERAVELVRSGAIGELRSVHSAFSFRMGDPETNIRMKPDLGGGALMDVGCYCVNVGRTLAGAEPVEVQAWATWAKSGVDAQLAGSLRFASGLVAQVDCAFTVELRQFFEAGGTDASLTVKSAFVAGTDRVAIVERRGKAPETSHEFPGTDQYRHMVEHFADCALHDRPLRYPASEAAANMAVLEALYRSARYDGTPVKVGA